MSVCCWKSSGFSRGASIYRGVTRHHQHGRWQARIGRVSSDVAWLWSDVGTPASLEDKHVLHAIAMEDRRCARPLSCRLTRVCHRAYSREERKKRKRKDVGPTPPRRG
uniref:Uncharacterized protein n=1 Tax=Oryza barthii TaxID=65489 RepID=A0A0D3F3P6_9ORYZ